ncbi:hypothetical protein F5Y16DRAFT_391563 [Xylariaceae sp. FL0255]|nr:hypothetical protein F5Y16DRAFT_391563 [Xylariaceae sp. FL0255]
MSFTFNVEHSVPSKEHSTFEHLKAKTIDFVVGDDSEVFRLHPGFLSQLSHPLGNIIHDTTARSSKNGIVWKEVDSTTFLRFAEFAYTGKYHCPVPTKLDNDNVSSEPLESYASDAFALPYSLKSYNAAFRIWSGAHGSCPHSAADDGKKRKLGAVACNCSPSEITKHFISAFLSQYCGLVGSCFPHSNMIESVEHLIGHAQLWIIGAKYDITALMDKALSNLARELAEWRISSSTFIPQFEKFVRYVYTNTSGCCKLRQVVASFSACIVEDVGALEGWKVLLADMPDFTIDLVGQMGNRRVVKHLSGPDPPKARRSIFG